MIVIDASVAVKLYHNETGSEAASDLLATHAGALCAPHIFAVEVAGALVREANSEKSLALLQRTKLSSFAKLLGSGVVELVGTAPEGILAAALLAIDLGHPLKDCLYLALAMERQCPLATADVRFAQRAVRVWERIDILAAE